MPELEAQPRQERRMKESALLKLVRKKLPLDLPRQPHPWLRVRASA
jgi:hypothetical protein